MIEFAPVIGLAIAFLVLLRVLIWRRRREERARTQRRAAALRLAAREDARRSLAVDPNDER